MNLGLNPFEFRAGLEPAVRCQNSLASGLNPFEFRAGLERLKIDEHGRIQFVLIPLNSGLAWSTWQTTRSNHRTVLIPLNSGLAWSRQLGISTAALGGLNPFEFRAGLEHSPRPGIFGLLRLNPFEFRAGLEPAAQVVFQVRAES